ncbi:tRNA delta(2)-isopentenylpyrophosphate transferase [Streptococcus pneumoniae SP9-BS68]|uniref:Uncharacterized protein n=1 Tax=Streptococcus pneumoniae (strain ATCC BAA-255 / R6) TaxID=171101 RepID=Q8CZ14_STRR6|nr:Hypothetical protein spr0587 [Streptococcus pneumoniae R6]ACB89878.1 hypothetical protein SPCG_0627 [Streptococcus pneumoniae CGSP14]EDK63988.1 tRNA delta(2)-isopentenylpyrophosphate transferase [Streptococcus pneumoniae SP11-BS70]EDK66669.1 thymidylate synthase [Streptococcus pneumoniae SP14-BS69]EDK69687.1 thymidylate synthase [Streptococcus pneumoniae SP18-BS74]EDK72117.1 tRNA delta(2)-isopentenylpyrophosphate transferase [Streptococcus pneumoniae SP19-BS75]EDK73570.1 thymidylate syntha
MKAAFCSSGSITFFLNAYTAPATAATVPATPVTRPLANPLAMSLPPLYSQSASLLKRSHFSD